MAVEVFKFLHILSSLGKHQEELEIIYIYFFSISGLPIVLKGILTAEDAEEALRHDVAAILVSNHGARQVDGVPATVSKNYCRFLIEFC